MINLIFEHQSRRVWFSVFIGKELEGYKVEALLKSNIRWPVSVTALPLFCALFRYFSKQGRWLPFKSGGATLQWWRRTHLGWVRRARNFFYLFDAPDWLKSHCWTLILEIYPSMKYRKLFFRIKYFFPLLQCVPEKIAIGYWKFGRKGDLNKIITSNRSKI